MKKSLTYNGTGWEIHIPKPILRLLNLDPVDAKVLFTTRNKILYVSKIDFENESGKYKNALVRRFAKRGGGHALFLAQPVIELIGVDPKVDKVEIEVNDEILTIKKA